MSDASQLKQHYRENLSKKRKKLTPSERDIFSNQIIYFLTEYLSTLSEPNGILQLLVYHALPNEVDTSALFHDERFEVYVPRMLPELQMEWLAVGRSTVWKPMDFGVQEPNDGMLWKKSELKTVLVAPLLGFDRMGNRLGMGKGYFDRWLETHAGSLDEQLGLAFSCQELPKVPAEQHDAPLSKIITEHGVIACPTI